MLLKRYLSDEIAPMIFSDTADELFAAPPEIVASEIQSWIGDQIRGSSNMTPGDLIYHAATKLHQLGVLELMPTEDVSEYLGKLQPHLKAFCPPEQQAGLEQNLQHLARSTGISSSKTEVIHKQGGGPSGGYPPAPSGPAAGQAPGYPGALPGVAGGGIPQANVDPATVQRLNLLLDRLKQAPTQGGTAETPVTGQNAVAAQVVEEMAESANSSSELETQLGFLKDLGIASLGSGVFDLLSKGLPDWAPPDHESVQGGEAPASAARAMRKVVKLSKSPEELQSKFKDLISVAVEEFNGGSLGRSVTMLDLAGRMIDQGEISAELATPVVDESFAQLDLAHLNTLADDPDKRMLLHRLMRFFPELRAERLLERLVEEQDREQRLQLLKLMRAHGEDGRSEAVHALDESVHGQDRRPWHVERNLLYLMRAIPTANEENVEHEIDLLNTISDLHGPIQVVRESFLVLANFRHPRAYAILAARIADLEDALQGSISLPLDAKETRLLISGTIKQLCQDPSNDALEIAITHGLKGIPQLGDTYQRLAQLGASDLGEYPAQLVRILDVIRQELPRRILGMSVKNQRRALILEPLISAVSGTRTPEVRQLLTEISEKYEGQTFAKKAQEALQKIGRPPSNAQKPSEDSITLSGDLALFGLPNLLQNLADNGLTGALSIVDQNGVTSAEIRLAEGNMLSAHIGNLKDEIAVYQLLERPAKGRFAFVDEQRDGENQPSAEGAKSVMGLLMEGMRRFDEFNRALSLVPDDASFKSSGKKPTDVKEDGDPKLAKEVWARASKGSSPASAESEIAIDSFRVRRLYEHWVTEGSLVPSDPSS